MVGHLRLAIGPCVRLTVPALASISSTVPSARWLAALVSAPAAKGASHRAEGTVDSVDTKAGTVSLSHGPVASLKWPAMTMEFKAANAALLQTLKPGAMVTVEFVERQPGEWVITSVKPMVMGAAAPASATAAGASTSHAGH